VPRYHNFSAEMKNNAVHIHTIRGNCDVMTFSKFEIVNRIIAVEMSILLATDNNK
jgi:hypothetical protein